MIVETFTATSVGAMTLDVVRMKNETNPSMDLDRSSRISILRANDLYASAASARGLGITWDINAYNGFLCYYSMGNKPGSRRY